MMFHKVPLKLCRLCGKETRQGTDVFKDKVKGAVLISIINKYLSKEVINILVSDAFSKFVCVECEQKIYVFDEFCLMVANVQKQLTAPALEIDFAEDMLCHLKENDVLSKATVPYREKRKSICDICSKSFRCQAHLNRHKRIHTGARPFICNICNMSFNQQEILTKHRETHDNKKQFQCANCHQSFRYKVSLQSHLVTFHTDTDSSSSSMLCNRGFSVVNTSSTCLECGKIFATKYKLQRHCRSHSGDRPYTCSYCNRTFSQTGNLKQHQVKCHNSNCIVSETSNSHQHLSSEGNCEISNVPLNNFQSIYITESEIQKTINETINSTDQGSSYLSKSFASPIYIDEEIETMLDQDLEQLDSSKYRSSEQEKVSLCLKQPETPELLHSLLYDE
ncbi:zinc finger protein 418 isoform X1 [Neodiprion pinetum]|uniref:zinc finger and SCAN domain-containing protein 10-like isoform X1 n=2 Tax=Neodiprion fabricii TaxID=2872261 RepID=UPI001ED8D064|nr:zinc finger and SCAN domain-containing protein 10-like isoform X1 [Neodiprion fabricii]XP_046466647.1 zinc finger and SCAN domain-containing protein 10-like isoform X1 [Neodiprion pinetum]XP_046606447.1 zinc finger and SCAN domain-containing protein 10-like isoform X1 [Neodiprion virginianus]